MWSPFPEVYNDKRSMKSIHTQHYGYKTCINKNTYLKYFNKNYALIYFYSATCFIKLICHRHYSRSVHIALFKLYGYNKVYSNTFLFEKHSKWFQLGPAKNKKKNILFSVGEMS